MPSLFLLLLLLLLLTLIACLGGPSTAVSQRLPEGRPRSWNKPGDPCSSSTLASRPQQAALREACELNRDAVWARARMPVQTPGEVPLAPPLPRIHVADLHRPENLGFKLRRRPFVLVGAMAQHADGSWRAMSDLRLRKQTKGLPSSSASAPTNLTSSCRMHRLSCRGILGTQPHARQNLELVG